MKLRIETDEAFSDEEIVIRCRELTDDILELQRRLNNLVKSGGTLTVNREDMDYFLKFPEILFLETDGTRVAVHTKKQIYSTKQKLYELEELLPTYFMRVSKSTILNLHEVRGIHKNITGASEIEFANSEKKTYVSQNYYKQLMERLTTR